MSQNQKRAWGNLIIWGSYLVAVIILLSINNTVYFWQGDSLRDIFYVITGIAVVFWFLMMLIVWLSGNKSRITADERDDEIMSRVNSAAGPIAMTAVAASSLCLMIVYLEDKDSLMSPYFLVYLTLINIVIYWLAQAIITLISYRRS